MTDLKNIKTNAECEPKNLTKVAEVTGNLYEGLNVIAKRANQMNVKITHELKEKLNEFSSTTDDLEEIHENLEQIEISKFYERLPKPSLLAYQEYLDGNIYHRDADVEELN
jgi:DNA-directed RNA polymerase subunit K/omega